jgi:hypothetical protein
MQMFMVNKQLFMNIGLNEIKTMSPEDVFLLVEQMKEIGKATEQHGV